MIGRAAEAAGCRADGRLLDDLGAVRADRRHPPLRAEHPATLGSPLHHPAPLDQGETVQRQTQRWLVEHGFDLPTVIVHTGSRGELAAALELDVLLDDTVQHCVDVLSESTAIQILVLRRDDPQTAATADRLVIRVVRSVAESLDYLEELNHDG